MHPRLETLLRRLGIRHGREIYALAAPTVLTSLAHTLMWTVSMAFLGHVSSLALAAAGLGGMITWTGYCIFNNLSRVTSTFISQANGEGDDAKVGHYIWQGLYVSLAAGALLTVAGVWSDRLLPVTGVSAEIQSQTYVYIKYRTLSAVGTQLTLCLAGFFQGRRDVHTPMIAAVAANVLNVVLDYLLIFGWDGLHLGGRTLLAAPAMGVKGAAIATSASVFLNAAILLVCFFAPRAHRRRFGVHRPRRPAGRALWDLARIGLPSSVDNFIDMFTFSVFSALIGRAGAPALAASQITIQLLSFSFMPMWGITVAGTVLVGNEIGRKDPDQAERYGREVYRVGVYYTLFLAIALALFGRSLFSVFTPEADVLRFAGTLALLAAVFQIGDGLRMVAVGVLQGAGDTRFPLILSVCVLCGVFMPFTYVMVVVRGGSVVHAWVVGTVAYALMAAGLTWRFQSGAWKRIRIFSDGEATREPAPAGRG